MILFDPMILDEQAPTSNEPLTRTSAFLKDARCKNDTGIEILNASSIHELFEAQVERTPDAVAIFFHQDTLTFRELNTRANQLAHFLQRLGVTPETPVVFCLERSLEIIVALFGILKAGGAYVPLDPASPPARMNFVLQETDARIVVTHSHLTEKFSRAEQVIALDTMGQTLALESRANPPRVVNGLNLAYILYTSGTTGQPKGVMISHRALVNHALVFGKAYELSRQDRVLLFAPIFFDVAAEEIFPTLAHGGTVVIRDEQQALTPRDFFEFLAAHQITVINLPTAFWHLLAESIHTEHLSVPMTVRLTIMGGEQVSVEKWNTWCAHVGPRVRWLNAYGPTEATIDVALHEPSGAMPLTELMPIGRAVPNVELFILDAQQELVPIGAVGELYIGGECLARGYLKAPERTAECFMPHPFSTERGARLYRTGDRARALSDGSIVFMGRQDQQIKLRGYRIELGEIENALREYPGLQECVVLAHSIAADSKRLVAFYTTRPRFTITSNMLRDFIQERLPDYMVPTMYVPLDAFPLTATGKIDRRALRVPEARAQESTRAYSPARTSIEKTLVEIWERVLQTERVGVDDSFFELGGDSLLAAQVISRAERALQRAIPLRLLFEFQTIAQLARALQEPLPDAVVVTTSIPRAPRAPYLKTLQ